MAIYHVPIKMHRRRARTKAMIAFTIRFDGAIIPSVGRLTQIVTVEADTHEDAYRKLCVAVLPDDQRPIMCKRAIRLLADKPRWAEVDHRGRALIGADYLEERCSMPELAESIRIMVRDATERRLR